MKKTQKLKTKKNQQAQQEALNQELLKAEKEFSTNRYAPGVIVFVTTLEEHS